jgi:pimeloyl-ACP methyl ester carboxylesterase
VLETLIPGVEPFFDPGIDAPLWHGEFHMVPDLPEALVGGREAIYFRYFFDIGTAGDDVIGAADIAHYAAAYGAPERLHAGFEVYRAIPAGIAFNLEQTDPIDVPLLLAGGEHVFGPPLQRTAEALRASFGWRDVRAEVLAGGRHYLVDERPAEVAALIEDHAR